MCTLCTWLLIIGGLNWGLIGLGDWNLVNMIFGGIPWLETLVYILVGIAAIGMLAKQFGWCKMGACKK